MVQRCGQKPKRKEPVMSYILEALKRLEEKRRGVERPHDLLSAWQSAPRSVGRRSSLVYFLLAALILNAGLLLWWLRPWQPALARRTEKNVESTVPQTVVGQTGANREIAIDRAVQSVHAGSDEERERPVVPVSPARPAETGPEYRRNEISVSGSRKVYDLNDLPPSVRQDLPAVTIAGHFYSPDPSARVVVINGKMAREGQVVTGNLRLEQITPEGVVMSFQGYRFRRAVF